MLDRATIAWSPNVAAPLHATSPTKLSPADVENLVAFLASQKARDLTEESHQAGARPVLPYARIANAKAEPQNWPTYWGDYHGHISATDQITPPMSHQLADPLGRPHAGPNAAAKPRPSWWTA